MPYYRLTPEEKNAKRKIKTAFGKACGLSVIYKRIFTELLFIAPSMYIFFLLSRSSNMSCMECTCLSTAPVLLVSISGISLVFDIRVLAVRIGPIRRTVERLAELGELETAAAEFKNAVMIEDGDYPRKTIQLLLGKNYFFSGRSGEGVRFADIQSCHYQPDEDTDGDVGRLIIHSADRDEPYSFYISTDRPERTARRITDRIEESKRKGT